MANGKPLSIAGLDPKLNKIVWKTKEIDSVLDKIGNRPFVPISILGKKGTGKSFLLNFFLRKLIHPGDGWTSKELSSSFESKGGSERTTIGIDIWSEPLITKLTSGQEIAILLIDTQGLFDEKTTFEQNAEIFAISNLLSSITMYNCMCDLGEDDLNFLDFFTSYSAIASNLELSDSNTTSAFQSLMFLIRDFQFNDYTFGYYDEEEMPSGQVLSYPKERYLSKSTQSTEIQSTREHITDRFEGIGCFLIPEPGKEVRSDVKDPELDPEFKQNIEQLVEKVLSDHFLVKKKVNGAQVTASEFKTIIREWSKLFEQNELPKVDTIFNTALNIQHQTAKTEFFNSYGSQIEQVTKSNPNGLTDADFKKRSDGILQELFKMLKRMESTRLHWPDNEMEKQLKQEAEDLHFSGWNQVNKKSYQAFQIKADNDRKAAELRQKQILNQQRLAEQQRLHQLNIQRQQAEVARIRQEILLAQSRLQRFVYPISSLQTADIVFTSDATIDKEGSNYVFTTASAPQITYRSSGASNWTFSGNVLLKCSIP